MTGDSQDIEERGNSVIQSALERAELACARSELEASRAALERTLESHAFLESVLNASADCIKVLSLEGDLIFMNDGGQRVMEVEDFEAIRGCPWIGFWEGDGLAAATEALEAARAGGSGQFVGAANTAKGTPKYWDVTVKHIPATGEGPGYILSISRDITQARRSEEQRELLSRELIHRVKNSLAIVQAIASQTFRGSDGDKLRDFSARLAALGGAQDKLLQRAWESVAVRDVVHSSLLPLCPDGRCHFEGDDHLLDARRGLSLALALHELGTNAVKYGAFSGADGEVRIAWGIADGQLHLTWTENGGPPVVPPVHKGFGTRIVTRNLEADFGGTVELNYLPGGVVLTLTAPV